MADTLYELIGGRLRIQAGVKLFYEKVLADSSVSHFFTSADMDGLRAKQSMFVSMLLGGKTVYTGKDLTAAHAGSRRMGMNDLHFDTILRHFREALTEIGVESEKVERVMALLESTRKDVLAREDSKA
jgi:hemoglobin